MGNEVITSEIDREVPVWVCPDAAEGGALVRAGLAPVAVLVERVRIYNVDPIRGKHVYFNLRRSK